MDAGDRALREVRFRNNSNYTGYRIVFLEARSCKKFRTRETTVMSENILRSNIFSDLALVVTVAITLMK